MPTPAHEPILETEIFPDAGFVVIEDLGTQDVVGLSEAGHRAGYEATRHRLDIYTMSADESDMIGREVIVRVYAGDPLDTDELGQLIFDGELDITTGILAISELLSPSPNTATRSRWPSQ